MADFVLAFAFFTALMYAGLVPRTIHQRSAVVISASLGLSLSVGLVWWELQHGWSIRHLGPAAVGFAIIVLGMVMYRALKQVGGSWGGAGVALGASLIIASLLGSSPPIDQGLIQSIIGVALTVGILAFFFHTNLQTGPATHRVKKMKPIIQADRRNHEQVRRVDRKVRRDVERTGRMVKDLDQRPEKASDLMLQIRRLLPAQGWLTKRMAELRAKAHRVRHGHIARLKQTSQAYASLSSPVKKKAAAELIAAYRRLVDIDALLEQLDKAVATNEQRIGELTEQAAALLRRNDHRGLHEMFEQVKKLAKHNTQLFSRIEATEKRIDAVITQVAEKAKQVNEQ